MSTVHLTTSVIIPTRNRSHTLTNVLYDLAHQTRRPDKIIISDSSTDNKTLSLLDSPEIKKFSLNIKHVNSREIGAAIQRNLGAKCASGDILFFFDDDIRIDKEYIEHIANLFENDTECSIGAAGGVIANKPFYQPSRINRWWLHILEGVPVEHFDGRVIGPVITFYPDGKRGNPFYVDWLPGPTIAVRREVFSIEKFGTFFCGYSYKEDVELTLRISKRWKVVCVPTAKVTHEYDSFEKNLIDLSRQDVVNTYYVMTRTMKKNNLKHKIKFFIYYLLYLPVAELKWGLFKGLDSKKIKKIWKGRLSGLWLLRRILLKNVAIEDIWK